MFGDGVTQSLGPFAQRTEDASSELLDQLRIDAVGRMPAVRDAARGHAVEIRDSLHRHASFRLTTPPARAMMLRWVVTG